MQLARTAWTIVALALGLTLTFTACSDSSTRSDGRVGGDGSVNGDARGDGALPGDGSVERDGPRIGDGPQLGCTISARRCAGTSREALCQERSGAPTWIESDCPADTHCVDDRCVQACVDLCFLGEERLHNGTTERCRIYSTTQNAFIDDGPGTHDRMRRYLQWLRRYNLPNGYIGDPLFRTTSYDEILHYFGTVDAGEWTGVYLALESLRLMATRAPDAEAAVIRTSEKMCQLFDVTSASQPQPGYMARFWAAFGDDPIIDKIYDAADPAHKTATYNGKAIFYQSFTSRDMYQGALMGLGLAYDALQTEVHKKRIRETVLTLASELIKERKAVPVKLSWGSTPYPLPIVVDLQHVIMVPEDMEDGAITVTIGTAEDPNDFGASDLRGLREFFPDFAPVLRQLLNQIPIVGPPAAALVPAINRASSAASLAYFLRLALHVSADVLPGDADYARVKPLRDQIEAHYMSLKPTVIPMMKEYQYLNAGACWKSYFGLTIAMHPTYGLLRLERDAEYRAATEYMLRERLWPVVKDHKNLYFTLVAAGQGPANIVSAATLADVPAQLGQIREPPKSHSGVDNTSSPNYPPDSSCQSGAEGAPMTVVATNLADRVPVDFIWQHHPFRLQTWEPTPEFVHPGHDYLIAYWMARYYKVIGDDAPGTCLRWQAK